MTATQTQHKVVSRDEWRKARQAHLASEKEFTRKRDELSRQRRELPMVRIEATALITYLVGLLVLKHGGRIDVLANNAPVLLAHYTKNLVARLSGGV
jgi:hypothetical protein